MEEVRDRIYYEPETGEVYWIKPSKYKYYLKGAEAGYYSKQSGYYDIKFIGKSFRLHRIIWLYMTGEWPKGQIDHINQVRSDNRWLNLRDVTNRQNSHNRKSNNKYIGVYKRGLNRWEAQTTFEGKCYYLGSFNSEQKALKVYSKFKEENNIEV